MGKADQRERALSRRLATEIGTAVFGDDILHVHPSVCGHLHSGDDTGDGAVLGGGFQPDEGFSAFRKRGALDEIKLPAGAAILMTVDVFSVDLTIKVDFDGRVHADHVVVLADDVNVIHVRRGVALHGGIVVQEAVDFVVSHSEGEYMFARMKGFLTSVDDTALDEADEGVAQQFRMNAKVLVSGQVQRDGIGQIADAKLQKLRRLECVPR